MIPLGEVPPLFYNLTFAIGVPAHIRVGNGIGRGKVRLDVEQRRAVKTVEPDN